MSTPQPPGVVHDVLRLTNETYTLARGAGRSDLTELLAEQAAHWSDGLATVVLAGAQKRGKSRLINAIVGKLDLLPVDADIASHTHVSLVHGEQLGVVVHRETDGVDTELTIDVAELPDYASTLGDPRRRAGVTGVEITLPSPALQGLRLVDTPGVDSLTLGHRHATTAALIRADTLLFAVSAQGQPVLRHELEFLAEAAERLRDIAFVLTKIEDSISWEDLLVENRQRLETFVAQQVAATAMTPEVADRLRAARWLPVSAKLAEAARRRMARGEEDRARELVERSGMGSLNAHLRRCADRRTLLRAGGVLTLTSSVLQALAIGNRDIIAAAGTDEKSLVTRLARIDAELAEVAHRQVERKRRAVDHQFLAHELIRRTTRRLDSYRRGYEQEIASLSTGSEIARYADALPGSLDRSLDAGWTEARAETEALVIETLDRYLAELGVESVDLNVDLLTSRPGAGAIPAIAIRQKMAFDLAGDGLPAAMMAGSAGWMTSALLGAAVSGLSAVILPVAVGGLVATTIVRHRRDREQVGRDRAAMQRAVQDAFGSAATEMRASVEKAVATLRAEAEQRIDLSLSDQRKTLESRRSELRSAAAQDARARAKAGQAAEDLLHEIEALTRRAESYGARLASAGLSGPSGASPD